MPLGPVSNFDQEWGKIAICMDAMYTMTGCESISAASFMYSVYRICISNVTAICHAEKLYRTLEKYFIAHVTGKKEKINAVDSFEFLTTYVDEWTLYSLGTEVSKDLFSYLEQNWIRNQICPDPLWESESNILLDDMNLVEDTDVSNYEPLCMKIWKEYLFISFGHRITNSILELLERERKGESIQHSLISQIVASCVQMNNDQKGNSIYLDFIESPYLEAMHGFYMKESILYIEENGALNYLRKALERIEEEQTRTLRYLQLESKEQADNIINQVLIESHKDKILKEFQPCLLADKTEDLHRMFLLFQRVEGGFHPMTEELLHYIEKYGYEYLESATKVRRETKEEKIANSFEVVYTEALLDIYLTCKELISVAFQNHPLFVAVMEQGFRNVVNKNKDVLCQGKYTPAQLVAQYCDYVLRSNSSAKLEEAELEKRLEHCTQLFKFIDDKDIFQKQYSIYLASRLIDDNSNGEEHEQQFIRGLQATSGLDYTSKLQRMFQDMKIGNSLSLRCREQWEKEKFLCPLDFSALILTSGSWPISDPSQTPCILPNEFTLCINHFENFYNTIHSGRRLTWIHHFSRGEVYAFYQKTYQITMPTYMIVILLLFNSKSILNFTQIQSLTNLSDGELKRALKVLVVQRLLVSDLKTLSKETKFKVNPKFKEKRMKLKLGSKALVEKARPVSSSSISSGRKLLLQSAIVRIMKMRKEASHNDLVQEVFSLVSSRFVPEVQHIKRVIETLIEKEYLDRVEGENKYRYLA